MRVLDEISPGLARMRYVVVPVFQQNITKIEVTYAGVHCTDGLAGCCVIMCFFFSDQYSTLFQMIRNEYSFCGFPWVVTSTGPGGFMLCVCIL